MNEINEAIKYHLAWKSGKINCIIVSKLIFEQLEKELKNVTNFEFDKTNMKYRGIDFYISENLKNKTIKIY